MARVALTNDDGSLYGAPAAWLNGRYPVKADVPPRTLVADDTHSEALARFIDFGTGSHRIAIAGDSTMNDSSDSPRKVLLWAQDKTPAKIGLTETQFNATNQTYNAPVVVRAVETTADTGGTVLEDNFNRTASELVGSTTSGGQTWGGVTGSWSANGSVASSTDKLKALVFDTGSKTHTVTAGINVTTAAPAVQQMTYLYAGSTSNNPPAGGDYLFVMLRVSTGGDFGVSLYKRIGGVQTQIGSTTYATGIAKNVVGVQAGTVSIDVAIQQITVTITVGETVTTLEGTVTEAESTALGQQVGVSQPDNTLDGITIDSMSAVTPFVAGETSALEILNGAVSGTTLSYQEARISTLYPSGTHIDSIVVTGSHNNGTQTPAVFIAEVDSFVTAYKAAHPESRVAIMSQNPQTAPASTIESHARRQAALRAYAMENGYEYIPVFEAFKNHADGGLSLMQSDGIHPTVSDPMISLGWSGATLVASVWVGLVNSRRQVGVTPAITALP